MQAHRGSCMCKYSVCLIFTILLTISHRAKSTLDYLRSIVPDSSVMKIVHHTHQTWTLSIIHFEISCKNVCIIGVMNHMQIYMNWESSKTEIEWNRLKKLFPVEKASSSSQKPGWETNLAHLVKVVDNRLNALFFFAFWHM